MLPVNPVPILQIPTGIGTLLGGLALGAFLALVIGFFFHRPEEPAPTIDVPLDVDSPTADKPARVRVSA
jgi:hypothetical protein